MKVSIGVVALNEEKTLPSLFEDFKSQTYSHDEIEIILVDGISTDNTKEIMQTFKDNNDFLEVKILDNPKKIQSAGWNIVIKNFMG
ncbi:glycosyltransferase, partial [Parvimonas micra]